MYLPQLRRPIVLIHGLLGFNHFHFGGRRFADYFPGIREALIEAGNRVLCARVSPTGSIRQRALELRNAIRQFCGSESVNIIGHSMGGLDARYMINKLDMDSQVLSLTTVGTPHRGSSFADWGVRRFERLLKPICRMLGMPTEAFYDLTVPACRQFNEEIPNVPSVRYFSVAGRGNSDWLGPEWRLPHSVVSKLEGPNDGVVSVESARWGERFDEWDGNHMDLVNWPNPTARLRGVWQDRVPYYATSVGRLAEAGF